MGEIILGSLEAGLELGTVRGEQGWGITVQGRGLGAAQPRPVCVEVWDGSSETPSVLAVGYQTVRRDGESLVGTARVVLEGEATLTVEDHFKLEGAVLRLERRTKVEGSAKGGFATGFTLRLAEPLTWPDVDAFAPGNLYGWGDHVPPNAFGGVGNYIGGVRQVRIREDRLPAPLFGLHLRDGTSLAVLNPRPHGETTLEDARDLRGEPLTDRRFGFAALGAEERGGGLELGGWLPGSEGEITYLADTPFSDGTFGGNRLRRWRRRFHPIEDGLEGSYALEFRLGAGESFVEFVRENWRWAWSQLKPKVAPRNLAAARSALAEVLEESILEVDGRSAPVHAVDSVTARHIHTHAGMGFTARALDTAYYLLRLPTNETRRARALAVLETFARLPMAPPLAEGFMIETGQAGSGVRDRFYLRSVCEGGKAMLRAYLLERERGLDHPHWLRWCLDLAGWLLAQELPGGGFPRAWNDHTALVRDPDPRSSYNAVAFLVELGAATGEAKYLEAAVRAGEVCWALGQSRGIYIGGTIDNPNITDKEAGTLPLEAYVALYEATQDRRWLTRAGAAADFSETWMYIWEVPMLEDDSGIHFKPGVTTVGTQLIASGHSLTDAYMAWDVVRYAKLWRYTGDAHYLEVAAILLHNTKAMLALPEHPYDLRGLGWQQEHWSFAPPRGRGVHRHWLPWVAVSQLEGLLQLDDYDPQLYAQLAGEPHAQPLEPQPS